MTSESTNPTASSIARQQAELNSQKIVGSRLVLFAGHHAVRVIARPGRAFDGRLLQHECLEKEVPAHTLWIRSNAYWGCFR